MTEAKELKVEDIKKSAEEKGCPVQKALYYITEFLSGPMCGRCFPCALGTYEAKIRLRNIVEGRGTEADLSAVERIAEDMAEGSLCKKGKDTAKFILEWMGTGVYKEHIEGRCPSRECAAFIEYRIIPEKCIMCGLCKNVCKYGAILGEKKESYKSGYMPFEIRQKRCVKCGDCISVCPTDAIVIIQKKQVEVEVKV
ncbi:MAG: 4Fe-4S binding protein [Nitrospirae bacterium]|nr:4Fe-4S binding protein [Nitrospirota bacterium]MCL5976542.1 4Fe-4S binding protein [Nitrospirota bacterium]